VEIEFEGRARVLGDNVDTDAIIRSQRKRDTIDPDVLKQWLLETVSPEFASSVRPGDVLVAGRNFWCGSAMEVAATVVLAAGIRAVVAQSVARAYYRNSINNGLLLVECDTRGIEEGDTLRLVVRPSSSEVFHTRTGKTLRGMPLPEIMLGIVEAGGLTTYIRERGCFPKAASGS
jgi:3-isopropylmalate/(R)-2-methylmalate dehydratase small subunit